MHLFYLYYSLMRQENLAINTAKSNGVFKDLSARDHRILQDPVPVCWFTIQSVQICLYTHKYLTATRPMTPDKFIAIFHAIKWSIAMPMGWRNAGSRNSAVVRTVIIVRHVIISTMKYTILKLHLKTLNVYSYRLIEMIETLLHFVFTNLYCLFLWESYFSSKIGKSIRCRTFMETSNIVGCTLQFWFE